MRIDGENTGVWEDIDLKSNRSHLVGANENTTTMSSPKNNFSENGKKWEQSEHIGEESTWLDDNREAGA